MDQDSPYVSDDVLYNIFINLDMDQLMEIAREGKNKTFDYIVNEALGYKINRWLGAHFPSDTNFIRLVNIPFNDPEYLLRIFIVEADDTELEYINLLADKLVGPFADYLLSKKEDISYSENFNTNLFLYINHVIYLLINKVLPYENGEENEYIKGLEENAKVFFRLKQNTGSENYANKYESYLYYEYFIYKNGNTTFGNNLTKYLSLIDGLPELYGINTGMIYHSLGVEFYIDIDMFIHIMYSSYDDKLLEYVYRNAIDGESDDIIKYMSKIDFIAYKKILGIDKLSLLY